MQASLGNRACSTACSSSAASSRGNLKRPARLLTRVQAAPAELNGNGAAPAAAAKKQAGAAAKSFSNTNRFVVAPEAMADFRAVWREREAAMADFPGYQGMHIIEEGSTMVVTSSWATIPEWEEWSLSPAARRTHMPMGTWQYTPKKGEGFPEDFVFIVNYDEPINAKYP